MNNRSGFRRFLLAGAAVLALSSALGDVARADVTFNSTLSAWGT